MLEQNDERAVSRRCMSLESLNAASHGQRARLSGVMVWSTPNRSGDRRCYTTSRGTILSGVRAAHFEEMAWRETEAQLRDHH
jgi:hypothetical protein